MKWLARVALGLVVAATLLVGGLYFLVAPPASLALPPQGATLDGVTVIEPGRGRAEGRLVVVAGGAIESVDAARGDANPWAGTFVTPGLVDMHVHFPPATLAGQSELFAFLFLYHGVTAVRDAGDTDGNATEPVRQGVAAGRFPGPRIRACGMFVDGDPPTWKNTILARNPEEGRRAVDLVVDSGYQCVKAYDALDAPTLAAIRDEAHARGVPVIGHVPRRVPYEQARLDDAQHLIGIPPPPADPSLRNPELLAQWEKLDDTRLDRLIAESKRLGIASTPTLVTIDRLAQMRDYERLQREPDALLLPGFYRQVVWNPVGGITLASRLDAAGFAMVERAFAIMKRTVKRMHDAGVRLHSGTDSPVAFVVPGAALHRELRIYVDAGMTPDEALAISTRDSAADFGVPGLGEIRPGAPADLVVFREDPTKSLDALDSIAAVIQDGRLYTRAALDGQLARYRAHFSSPVFEAVITPMVRRLLGSARN